MSSALIEKIIKQYNQFHNFKLKVKLYDETPNKITREEVEQFNE